MTRTRSAILLATLTGLLLAARWPAIGLAQSGLAKPLQIYVVDVEGGNAVLYVAPSGESVLIDTGNPGPAAVRDADRILAAAKDAGVSQIDHLITTHWHGDHFGGMEEVVKRLPVRQFLDHGPNEQPAPGPNPAPDFSRTTYPALFAKTTHLVVKPGDKIPVAGLDWRIVTSNGEVLKTPLPGAGQPNTACAGVQPQETDTTENARSVGSVITFGRFRVAQLGDLTWNKELELMCPSNRLGTVDLFVLSHHGLAISNSPALVHALAPRVIVMNNGIRKGGQPQTMKTVYTSPGLEDLWQVHFSELGGQENTAPGMFIANGLDQQAAALPIAPMTPPAAVPGQPPAPAPAHNGAAYWIKVSAQPDGSFTVVNQRNSFSKTYAVRGGRR
jgi:beta-lactamase superfamily II metal-dependent hydrolase